MSKLIELIILAGPSGVGKTSIVKNLLQDEELNLKKVVTITTRDMRENEIEGEDYYFVNYKTYADKLRKNELAFSVRFAGKFYGLEKKEIEKWTNEKKIPLFVGGFKDAESFHQQLKEKALIIKVLPESKEQLKDHLTYRDKGNTNALSERLSKFDDSRNWINSYWYSVTNHENKLNETIAKIKSIIIKETKEISLEHSSDQKSKELELE